MITATKIFSWDMAHMLAGHEGLCANLHGHTYKMEVTIARAFGGTINDGPSEGMVIDFKDLKNIVKELIVDPLDHCTVINDFTSDPFETELLGLLMKYHKKYVRFPYRPTAENMAYDFMNRINAQVQIADLPVKVVKLKLWETPTSYAEVSA